MHRLKERERGRALLPSRCLIVPTPFLHCFILVLILIHLITCSHWNHSIHFISAFSSLLPPRSITCGWPNLLNNIAMPQSSSLPSLFPYSPLPSLLLSYSWTISSISVSFLPSFRCSSIAIFPLRPSIILSSSIGSEHQRGINWMEVQLYPIRSSIRSTTDPPKWKGE